MDNKAFRHVPLLLILSLTYLSGCGVFSTEPDGKTLPIEGNILFNVREGYTKGTGPEKPVIQLAMRTAKSYPCANYEIRHTYSRFGNLILINLKEIFAPSICLTAFGCAGAIQPLNLSNGDYVLQIGYKSKFDRYRLVITDTSIQIDSIKASFATPESTLFWRYPVNSFTVLVGTMVENQWIYSEFMDSLSKNLSLQEIQFSAAGIAPYPRTLTGHYVNFPGRYFRYQNEGDFERAGEVLKAFSQNVIASEIGAGIWLKNWRNQQFMSWLYIVGP